MDKLRTRIDELDAQLLQQIAERLECSRALGVTKRRVGASIVDAQRERVCWEKWVVHGEEHDLAPEFLRALFELVVEESRRVQKVRSA